MKTPQTDDLARGNHVVPTEWAEQLERERDEAREALRTLAEHGENEIQKLIKERDEARGKYFAMRDLHTNATEIAEKYKRERDEARGQNAKLRDIAERAVERIEQENWGITEVADFWKQLRAELDRLKEGRG